MYTLLILWFGKNQLRFGPILTDPVRFGPIRLFVISHVSYVCMRAYDSTNKPTRRNLESGVPRLQKKERLIQWSKAVSNKGQTISMARPHRTQGPNTVSYNAYKGQNLSHKRVTGTIPFKDQTPLYSSAPYKHRFIVFTY